MILRTSRVALLLLLTMVSASCQDAPSPDFEKPIRIVQDRRLEHPSDIVKFKGRYVATELYRNRLAVFDDLTLANLEYFDPATVNQRFKAPHFLAVTPRETLLISNGWGNSIVEIADLKGNQWREFSGIGKKFDAPHGLCADRSGWIYVADSLNSRLVRFQDLDGRGWQVFADQDKRVSYIRQLVCADGVVWASNSYENRPGLNPGAGGNVLKIADFASGKTEIVFAFDKSNLTGIAPIGKRYLLVGIWGIRRQLTLFDIQQRTARVFKRLELGVPYGTHVDRDTGQVIVAHIGELPTENTRDPANIGGIAVFR